MAKLTFAVYDSDPVYVSGFLAYCRANPVEVLDFIGFSDLNSLEKYLKDYRISYLLFSEEDFPDRQDTDSASDRFSGHYHVGQFIYLGERRNSHCSLKHINKYQSMARIRQEILELVKTEKEDPDSGSQTEMEGTEILGIYAVEKPEICERFSISLTGLLAKERGPALYMGLDRFSLLYGCMEETQRTVMTDLLYLFSVNREHFTAACREKLYRQGSSWYLACPPNLEDFDGLSAGDIVCFLQSVAAVCGCRYIVLDIGEAFRSLEEIFRFCRQVFIPLPDPEERGIRTSLLLQYLSSVTGLKDRITVVSAKALSADNCRDYPGAGAGATGWINACREGEFAQMVSGFIRSRL